jgi:hypothetical protein
MIERELVEGVVGEKIVNYFQENYMGTPVKAEFLGYADQKGNEVKYRITFDDESVADYKLTFEWFSLQADITSAEEFNRVI